MFCSFFLLLWWAKERVETVVGERSERALIGDDKNTRPVQFRKDRAYVGRRPLQDSRSSQWSSQAVSYVASWAEKTAKNRLEHTDTAGFLELKYLGFQSFQVGHTETKEKLQHQVKTASDDDPVSLYWPVFMSQPWIKLAAELWQIVAIIMPLFSIMTVFYQTIFSTAPSDQLCLTRGECLGLRQ